MVLSKHPSRLSDSSSPLLISLVSPGRHTRPCPPCENHCASLFCHDLPHSSLPSFPSFFPGPSSHLSLDGLLTGRMLVCIRRSFSSLFLGLCEENFLFLQTQPIISFPPFGMIHSLALLGMRFFHCFLFPTPPFTPGDQ